MQILAYSTWYLTHILGRTFLLWNAAIYNEEITGFELRIMLCLLRYFLLVTNVTPLFVQIRRKMVEIMINQASSCDLKGLVHKFIPEMIGKEIEKATSSIYPLQNVFIRKVKILKAPKFDLGKLMEVFFRNNFFMFVLIHIEYLFSYNQLLQTFQKLSIRFLHKHLQIIKSYLTSSKLNTY